MRPMPSAVHILAAILMLFFANAALAQSAPPEEAWQKVITGQIEAFRQGDAPGALSFAGASFQDTFSSPTLFFEAIIASGYAPIVLSKSHSFGEFERTGEKGVMQVVKFVGPHLELFDAIYELSEEKDGWRVQGVMLGSVSGTAI